MSPKTINFNNQELFCFSERVDGKTWLNINGWSFAMESTGIHRLKAQTSIVTGNGEICAPMPGQILKILVKENQSVNEGDPLFIVEAMKMEHTLKAPCTGTVTDLAFKDGDTVNNTDVILKVVNQKKED